MLLATGATAVTEIPLMLGASNPAVALKVKGASERPMVFPLVVPILTAPAVTKMPLKTVAATGVFTVIPAMVFTCTLDAVAVPTVSMIGLKAEAADTPVKV